MVKKNNTGASAHRDHEPWSMHVTTLLFTLSGVFFCMFLGILIHDTLSDAAESRQAYARQRAEKTEAAASQVKTTPPPVAPIKPDCAVATCLALTFDDGPTTTTEPLLDVLKAHDAKATFFLLGIQVERYPVLAQRILRDGHAIGNHTYGHRDLMTIPLHEAQWEITHTSNIIESTTGYRPVIARAPYGSISDQRAQELGLPFVKWTVDIKDWEIKDAGQICQGVLAAASRNAVILSHDMYQSTLEGYTCAIPELKKRGFTLVGVQDLP